jgi:hypothetical protein
MITREVPADLSVAVVFRTGKPDFHAWSHSALAAHGLDEAMACLPFADTPGRNYTLAKTALKTWLANHETRHEASHFAKTRRFEKHSSKRNYMILV